MNLSQSGGGCTTDNPGNRRPGQIVALQAGPAKESLLLASEQKTAKCSRESTCRGTSNLSMARLDRVPDFQACFAGDGVKDDMGMIRPFTVPMRYPDIVVVAAPGGGDPVGPGAIQCVKIDPARQPTSEGCFFQTHSALAGIPVSPPAPS
jgi:hypothetical protein